MHFFLLYKIYVNHIEFVGFHMNSISLNLEILNIAWLYCATGFIITLCIPLSFRNICYNNEEISVLSKFCLLIPLFNCSLMDLHLPKIGDCKKILLKLRVLVCLPCYNLWIYMQRTFNHFGDNQTLWKWSHARNTLHLSLAEQWSLLVVVLRFMSSHNSK